MKSLSEVPVLYCLVVDDTKIVLGKLFLKSCVCLGRSQTFTSIAA